LPLSGNSIDFGGGLTGLDNMHPTVPGYSLIADAVLEAMNINKRTDKNVIFGRDTLLANIPPLLAERHTEVLRAVELIQWIGSRGMAAPANEAPAAKV
jgi:hypothetical protein